MKYVAGVVSSEGACTQLDTTISLAPLVVAQAYNHGRQRNKHKERGVTECLAVAHAADIIV